MKFHMHKVQCVIENPVDEEKLLSELQILHHEKRGSLLSFTARGTREEILDRVRERDPIFVEALPYLWRRFHYHWKKFLSVRWR